jgi:hypothetical protein
MGHFFKLLATFVALIGLGLAGVYLVNTYGQGEATTAKVPNPECVGEGC